MDYALFDRLLSVLLAMWWPFCRTMAMFSAAPMLGDNMVPVTVRILLSLVLAVALLPVAQPAVAIDPFSLHAIVATMEQAIIGLLIGFAFHLTMAIVMILGFLVSSQMGLSMAIMNDPMNGTSSDVVSGLLYMLCILVFFSIDGHLVLVRVVGESFKLWPVGAAPGPYALQTLMLSVSWIFAAALLLAIPVVFATFVVQLGFGLLNRVAPAFNLFSLGFSLVTLFGLAALVQLIRLLPEHYLRMTAKVLGLLSAIMGK